MAADADQLVLDYLGKVADLAQGQMSPVNRARLIDRLRMEIEAKIRDRRAEKAQEVRQILMSMGTAEALVMIEANKDPLYRARQQERLRTAGTPGYGGGSVFSPEVDPTVARMVTPESLTNPFPNRFGTRNVAGDDMPGPEMPLDPDPFGAGQGEWLGRDEGGEHGARPQVAQEGGGFSASVPAPRGAVIPVVRAPDSGPWMRRFGETAARSHTQAFVAIGVLGFGAMLNAVYDAPYTVAAVLLGYLLAMTSYSYTLGEKRFALIGVPMGGIVFYAIGLLLTHGRLTGHSESLAASGTVQAAKDLAQTVPTMIGFLAALYFTWRLSKTVARSG